MTDLAPIESGPLTLFGWATPRQVVQQATDIANEIAPLIRERQLVKRIGQSEHVYLEGWTLAGTMLGVFATTVKTWEIGTDEGYGATVEARTISGAVVGRADEVVMRKEEVGGRRKWLEAPAFQLISMAQTRASSKALRMPLGFVMKLAGYDTTPAEEMEAAAARGETVTGGKGVAPGWRDLNEQQRAFADLGEEVARAGLREWVATWIDSKGYTRPLAKGQFNQLKRALERERKEESSRPASDDAAPGRPAGATSAAGSDGPPAAPAADQVSGPGGPVQGEGTGEPGSDRSGDA
jgi:hypothetical protein